MIVDTRSQAVGGARTAICGFPGEGWITIGTADHSLKCGRDLLFLTDSSRIIHREVLSGLSVIDPGTGAAYNRLILENLMTSVQISLKRSDEDPRGSLRFHGKPV